MLGRVSGRCTERSRSLKVGTTATSLLRWGVIAWLVLPTASGQTELQYQLGRLTDPFSNQRNYTSILTLQQALRWKLGDSFFFADLSEDGGSDGFNEMDLYGEWYPTLSLGKLSGSKVGVGPIRDIALVSGINFDVGAGVFKYLPGVRLAWNAPGFVFLNTDITAFLDASRGAERGGAPRTNHSFMVDVSWLLPFEFAGQRFSFTGHSEYIGARTDEFGHHVRDWVLSQPQFTWDLGSVLGAPDRLWAGIEYQLWWNKLGTGNHDNVCQLLLVWRL